MSWLEFATVSKYTNFNALDINVEQTSKKLIMFDLDYTLVKSAMKFPKTANDWKWLYPEVPIKLAELQETYQIIIITNQLNRGDFIKQRINNIFKDLKVPITVYVANKNDTYRKPNTDIFELYICDSLIAADKSDIIYVGDAAGRTGDFSDSDRKFAYNIQLLSKNYKVKFYTPEEFFLNKPNEPKTWQGFNPVKFVKDNRIAETKPFIFPKFAGIQLLFILVGPPGSGKSTISKRLLKLIPNTAVINDSNVKHFTQQITDKNNVILDSTNPSIEIRAKFANIAKQINPQITIYYLNMTTFKDEQQKPGCLRTDQQDRELYQHVNVYRARITGVEIIPNIVYNIFYKKYQPPTSAEGVVFEIPFVPKFKSKKDAVKFMQKS